MCAPTTTLRPNTNLSFHHTPKDPFISLGMMLYFDQSYEGCRYIGKARSSIDLRVLRRLIKYLYKKNKKTIRIQISYKCSNLFVN